MKTPNPTPHITTTDIVTGHFHESHGYVVRRENGTGDWLLIYTVAGRGRFGHRTGAFLATRGDAVLLRPGTLHDYGVEPVLQRWELLWAHFQPRMHWMDWLDWPEEAPGLMRLRLPAPARRRVAAGLAQIADRAAGARRRPQEFALNSLERVLLNCDAVNPRRGDPQLDPRVRASMELLCRDLQAQISLDLLARRVSLSASRLSHLFRAQTGTTPQQFREIRRLDRAKQLLALTPHSIKQIAAQVGFESPFYFTLRFKRHTGQSPRSWRQQRQAAAERAPFIRE